jgi:DNA-directed RNA polymerase subunit RPC12/RpoP
MMMKDIVIRVLTNKACADHGYSVYIHENIKKYCSICNKIVFYDAFMDSTDMYWWCPRCGKIELYKNTLEIFNKAKEFFMKNYKTNETIQWYLKTSLEKIIEEDMMYTFGTYNYEKIDIEYVADNMQSTGITFNEYKNKIIISVTYLLAVDYTDKFLCIRMSDELELLDILLVG